jgi:hypothetical protein
MLASMEETERKTIGYHLEGLNKVIEEARRDMLEKKGEVLLEVGSKIEWWYVPKVFVSETAKIMGLYHIYPGLSWIVKKFRQPCSRKSRKEQQIVSEQAYEGSEMWKYFRDGDYKTAQKSGKDDDSIDAKVGRARIDIRLAVQDGLVPELKHVLRNYKRLEGIPSHLYPTVREDVEFLRRSLKGMRIGQKDYNKLKDEVDKIEGLLPKPENVLKRCVSYLRNLVGKQ